MDGPEKGDGEEALATSLFADEDGSVVWAGPLTAEGLVESNLDENGIEVVGVADGSAYRRF